MRRSYVIAILLQLVLSFKVFSLNCPKNLEIRLDKNGKPFSKMPIYSQGSELGTCYAYSAAQLLDYKRIKEKGPQTDFISPNFLAVQYYANNEAPSTKIDGGNTYKTLLSAKTFGSCPQSAVKDSILANSKLDETEYFVTLKRLFEYRNEMELFKEQYLQFEYQLKSNCGVSESVKPFNDMIALQKFMVDVNDPAAFVSSLQNIFAKECSRKKIEINFNVNQIEKISFFGKSFGSKILESILKENPAEITYCGGILRMPLNEALDAEYLKTKNGRRETFNKQAEKDCYPHSSVISGVKEVSGKCKFLIRNTWGPECNGYGNGWECEKNAGVWIDSDLLERNLFSTLSIE